MIKWFIKDIKFISFEKASTFPFLLTNSLPPAWFEKVPTFSLIQFEVTFEAIYVWKSSHFSTFGWTIENYHFVWKNSYFSTFGLTKFHFAIYIWKGALLFHLRFDNWKFPLRLINYVHNFVSLIFFKEQCYLIKLLF